MKTSKRQITILDIARETGLSKSTVSRAINSPSQVASKTLRIIEAAVKAHNYIPDGHARSLVTQRSITFAAVVPTLDNSIFAALLDGVQSVMAGHGLHVLVAASNYDSTQELEQLRTLAQLSIGGVILVGSSRPSAAYDFLDSRHIPYVLTSVYDENVPSIGWDNEFEASRIANLLLDLGHRRIAVIGGITKDNDRAVSRISGYHSAIRNRGVELDPLLTIESAYDIPSSRDAMRTFLGLPNPPTAVLCGNDVQAFGAIFECKAQQVRVPEDISIAGFDDLAMAAHFQPALTTMRSPAAAMGRRAAQMLFETSSGRSMPKSTKLELELILRQSTGPVARHNPEN